MKRVRRSARNTYPTILQRNPATTTHLKEAKETCNEPNWFLWIELIVHSGYRVIGAVLGDLLTENESIPNQCLHDRTYTAVKGE